MAYEREQDTTQQLKTGVEAVTQRLNINAERLTLGDLPARAVERFAGAIRGEAGLQIRDDRASSLGMITIFELREDTPTQVGTILVEKGTHSILRVNADLGIYGRIGITLPPDGKINQGETLRVTHNIGTGNLTILELNEAQKEALAKALIKLNDTLEVQEAT